MRRRITDKNYDLIFKLVASVFKGRILDFLGIECVGITRVFPTELPQLEANTMHTDFMFELEDGGLLHLEFQSDFTHDTLYRLFMYDARMVAKYRKELKTILVYSGNNEQVEHGFNKGTIRYLVEVIHMKQYDGDGIFSGEAEKIQNGKQPDWLNLIFFPMMKSKNSVKERVGQVIKLCSQTRLKKSHYEAVVSAVLVLSDKFLSQKDYENIWEEISMLNVIKFAEKKGIEKGIEKIVLMQLMQRIHNLSEGYIKRVEQLDEQKLEQIAKDIFIIEKVEDLERYLQ